eukprot:3020802-Lingulodinium_polyedra.AAC.1
MPGVARVAAAPAHIAVPTAGRKGREGPGTPLSPRMAEGRLGPETGRRPEGAGEVRRRPSPQPVAPPA